MRLTTYVLAGSLCAFALLAAGCGKRLDPRSELPLAKSPQGLPKARFAPGSSGYTNWCLQWSKDLCLGGYQSGGHQNRRWDGPAINALEEYAHLRVTGRERNPEAADYLEIQLRQAVKAGCTDPYVRYLHARRVAHPLSSATPRIAAEYSELARQMDASSYGSLPKFYVNLRASQAWRRAVRKQAPEVNLHRRAAMNHLQAVLAGEEIPAHAAYEACRELYEAIDLNRKQRTDFIQNTMPLLLGRWRKEGFPYLVHARFYLDYAWEARGRGWAKDVTPEAWRLFGDRLYLADKALKQAWKNDPSLAEAPLLAMRLQTGLGKGRDEMELWYERAIKFPQNSYEAVRQKLWFLEPRWYGSEEEMLAFAREVVKSDKFVGEAPLHLYHAHESLAEYFGNARANYWTEPHVWPDLKASFERFFALNGEDDSWRHNYIVCAWRCRQWATCEEQIAKLTDINYDYFGGQGAFEELKKHVRDRARGAK